MQRAPSLLSCLASLGSTILVPALPAQDEYHETSKLTAPRVGSFTSGLAFPIAVSGTYLFAGDKDAHVPVQSWTSVGGIYVFEDSGSGWAGPPIARLARYSGWVSYFALNVASSGDSVVAGDLGDNQNQGAAFVFVRPPTGWVDMTETAKLTASDGQPEDRLGVRVAISGDTIVVPAAGSLYVYEKPPTGWVDMTETAKLTASNGTALLGSVAIDGDTIVGGATSWSAPGAVYLFEKPGSGWVTATETAVLTASDGLAGDFMGNSVAVSGDLVAVGAESGPPPFGSGGNGAVYVFEKPIGGWTTGTETAKLWASDGTTSDLFARELAVRGNRIAVGAHLAEVKTGPELGAVYLFEKPPTGWVSGTETGYLFASDGGTAENTKFGISVCMDDDSIFVGRDHDTVGGAVYLFDDPYVVAPPVYIHSTTCGCCSCSYAVNRSLPQTVTLNGYGFSCVTDVRLGGASVAFSSVSDRIVQFTIPQGFPIGSHDLTVECSAQSSNTKTMNVVPVVPAKMGGATTHDLGATNTYSVYTDADRDVLVLLSASPGPTALPGIVTFPLGGGHLNAILVAATFNSGVGGVVQFPVTMPAFLVPPFTLHWSALVIDPSIPMGLQTPLETASPALAVTTTQ